MTIAWCAFLFIGIPLLYFGGAALKGNLFEEPLPFSTFFVSAAILVVWVNRSTMFIREGAITAVIPRD